MEQGQHYYSKEPISASHVRWIEYEISYQDRNLHLTFETDSGVFSISRVDHGTDILLHAIAKDVDADRPPQRVLDIGCGYGPIGITLGRFFPGAYIHMVDVNERAMDLARRNAQAAHLADAAVEPVSELAEDRIFDMVVTNPPIRAGKAVVYGIFQQAWEHLAPGGALYVVIRKNQGGPSAVKELTRLFGNCEAISRQSGFHILRCTREA